MSNRKQVGRSARKRFRKQQLSTVLDTSSESDDESLDVALTQKRIQLGKQLVAQKQALLLQSYRIELAKRASSLGTAGCWQFLQEALPEAKQWQIDGELRRAVALFAAKFAASVSGNVPVVRG